MSRVWSARPATVRSSQRLRVQTIRANDRFMAERACFGAEASVVFPKCPSICGVVFGLFMRWFLARARKKDSTNAFHEPPGEGEAPAEPTLEHLHPIPLRILEVVVFPTDSGLPPIGTKPNPRPESAGKPCVH